MKTVLKCLKSGASMRLLMMERSWDLYLYLRRKAMSVLFHEIEEKHIAAGIYAMETETAKCSTAG